MKLNHPTGLVMLIVLVAAVSVAGVLLYQSQMSEARSTNPIIEWVLLQPSANSGISVTIQGYNFTATNNEIRTKGKVLVGGLNSVDGVVVNDPNSPGSSRFSGMTPKIIQFDLPSNTSCAMGDACPVNIVNSNGTSNTVSFKL